MSEQRELRPCPFCGGAVSKCDESPLYGGSVMHDETECLFKGNLLFHKDIAERWNSRPLEDALRSRIAELEKSAIVWHKYPEEKPMYGKKYNVTIAKLGRSMVISDAIYSKYENDVDFFILSYNNLLKREVVIVLKNVIAFTEPIKPYLPSPPEEVSND